MGLIDDATQRRLDGVREGIDPTCRLRIAELEVGQWGVLDVVVEQVHPAKTFNRKRGGDGLVGRVTLRDESGAIDMVLWDDENRLTADGPLAHGTRLVVRGATVKAGWKGGLELGLGSAVLEPAPPADALQLVGTLVERSEPQVVGEPPRSKVEIRLAMASETVTVVCWDAAIKDVQGPIGTTVSVAAKPHPALDGYYIA